MTTRLFFFIEISSVIFHFEEFVNDCLSLVLSVVQKTLDWLITIMVTS